MSSKEFWEDDPNLFATYRFSYIEKEKRTIETNNYVCWLNGLYNHDGNGKLLSMLRHFIASLFKKQPPLDIDNYPSEPYDLLGNKKEKSIENKKQNKMEEYMKEMRYFSNMKEKFKNKYKKGE